MLGVASPIYQKCYTRPKIGKLVRFQMKGFVIGKFNFAMLRMIGTSHAVKYILLYNIIMEELVYCFLLFIL